MVNMILAVADGLDHASRDLWRRQLPEGLVLAFPDEPGWSGASILVTRRATVGAGLLDRLPGLRLAQQVGRFPTLVDAAACQERGVALATWPLLSRITVAEHAVALMLAVARSLGEGERAIRAAAYRAKGLAPVRTTETVIAWNWMQLSVLELHGKALGVLGAGEIDLQGDLAGGCPRPGSAAWASGTARWTIFWPAATSSPCTCPTPPRRKGCWGGRSSHG